MAAHSKYSPSAFERWSECPGSLQLIEAHPEILPKSSKYADEGTRLHSLAEEYLRKNLPAKSLGDWEAVGDYVLHVRKLANAPGARSLLEQRLSLEQIVPEMFGTADAIVYSEADGILHVVDYKGGAGVPVDVVGNTQLKIYALGALLTFPDFKAKIIQATIVQPRCFHPDGSVRSEVYSALELVDFWEDVRIAAERTKQPGAALKSGGHCRWCPVKEVCPTLQKAAHEVAAGVFSAIEPVADKSPGLDIAHLPTALSLIPQMEAWIESVREKAYREAMAGRAPEGYKLVEKRAHRKWEDESKVPAILEKSYGISPLEAFEKKLKSPAAIEKLLAAPEKRSLAKLVKVESTGSTLVPVSDPRPEVLVATASEVFSQIENGE